MPCVQFHIYFSLGAAPEAAAAVAAATTTATQPGITKPAVPPAPASTGSFSRFNTPTGAWTQAGWTPVSTQQYGSTPAPANEFRPSLDDDALHGPAHDAGPPSAYGLLFSWHASVRLVHVMLSLRSEYTENKSFLFVDSICLDKKNSFIYHRAYWA